MTIGRRIFILVATALMTAAGTQAHADTDAQKIATVKEMIQAWNTLNWNKVYDLFAKDGTLHSMMLEPTVGQEAVKKRIQGLATDISRIELKVRHIGVVDGVVFVERVDDFVYRGKHGVVPVVGVIEVENGRVQVWREYYDRAQLVRELGLKEDLDKSHQK